eukprot:6394963-Prymnesium_polylepis.1
MSIGSSLTLAWPGTVHASTAWATRSGGVATRARSGCCASTISGRSRREGSASASDPCAACPAGGMIVTGCTTARNESNSRTCQWAIGGPSDSAGRSRSTVQPCRPGSQDSAARTCRRAASGLRFASRPPHDELPRLELSVGQAVGAALDEALQLVQQLAQKRVLPRQHAHHREARVVAQPPQLQLVTLRLRQRCDHVLPSRVLQRKVLARANRRVEDVRLVQVAVVALAQVELIVELADPRRGLADLMAPQPALLLELGAALLLELCDAMRRDASTSR